MMISRSGNKTDKQQQLYYLINILLQLSRQKVDPAHLIESHILSHILEVVVALFSTNGMSVQQIGQQMVDCRPLILQIVSTIQEFVRPGGQVPANAPAGTPENPINPKSQQLIVKDPSGGLILERVLHQYKDFPDPKNPDGDHLYDESMCKRVFLALQDMISGGYQPSAPVSLDAPNEGEAVPDFDALTAAAAAKQMASDPLRNNEPLEIWTDAGKNHAKCRIHITSDNAALLVTINDKEELLLPFVGVTSIIQGVPVGTKKKLLGRSPKESRGVVLLGADGSILAHFEVANDKDRPILAAAIAQAAAIELM
jgi:hypothetical protein